MATNYVVGVDEVGRGPLAGPLLVAGVRAQVGTHHKVMHGIQDSKKLSEKQREEWFRTLTAARKREELDWRIAFVTAPVIDRDGIPYALRVTVRRVLRYLECVPEETKVLLDGGLYAPKRFHMQQTLVRGETKRQLIAAASIVAKVSRDRRMQRYARRFPEYGFDAHKGYGTKKHLTAIREHGPCELHRKTFIKT